jgi:hypothetical protein
LVRNPHLRWQAIREAERRDLLVAQCAADGDDYEERRSIAFL